MGNEHGKPRWESKDEIFPVLLVHGFHHLFHVLRDRWVVAVCQHVRKFLLGTFCLKLGRASIFQDATQILKKLGLQEIFQSCYYLLGIPMGANMISANPADDRSQV